MTHSKQLPDPEKMQHGADKLREACRQLDALNLILDDAIAQVEAENRRSLQYHSRIERAKKFVKAGKPQ